MAMLAEPKRKKKWSLNPRGKMWVNDESKLGQKLLEKMGWSKGKGLGREEQGEVEPVRLKYKNDAEGIGYTAKADEWLAHRDEFNAILGELNGVEKPAEMPDAVPVKSLEVRSKMSKARVHYHKFTRGKDLSRYSATDLACILGKRANPETEEASISVKEEAENGDSSDSVDHSHGVTTIHKGNINDYFASKMAAFNAKRPRREISATDAAAEAEETDCLSGKRVRFNEDLNEIKEFCSKKKIVEAVEDATTDTAAGGEDEIAAKKKDKKKKKRKEAEHMENGVPLMPESMTAEDVDSSAAKKKKKKKKTKETGDVVVNEAVAIDSNPLEKVVVQKAPAPEAAAAAATDGTVTNKAKKSKKKSKSNDTEEAPDKRLTSETLITETAVESSSLVDSLPEPSSEKKISKKNRDKNSGQGVVSMLTAEATKDCETLGDPISNPSPEKRKSKRKGNDAESSSEQPTAQKPVRETAVESAALSDAQHESSAGKKRAKKKERRNDDVSPLEQPITVVAVKEEANDDLASPSTELLKSKKKKKKRDDDQSPSEQPATVVAVKEEANDDLASPSTELLKSKKKKKKRDDDVSSAEQQRNVDPLLEQPVVLESATHTIAEPSLPVLNGCLTSSTEGKEEKTEKRKRATEEANQSDEPQAKKQQELVDPLTAYDVPPNFSYLNTGFRSTKDLDLAIQSYKSVAFHRFKGSNLYAIKGYGNVSIP